MAEAVALQHAGAQGVRLAGLDALGFVRLFTALIDHESRFNPRRSRRRAHRGLGQLMPATAADLGVRDPFDPRANLDGAARYLIAQLERFRRVDLALAAYNAGPHRVEQFLTSGRCLRGPERGKVLLQQRLQPTQESSPMPTECSAERMGFARVDGRAVVADFDGGAITSNAGGLLLGATDRAIGLVERFAACFSDGRAAQRVVHDVTTLVGQRVFGIALGYEDLIDHDRLRHDPVAGEKCGLVGVEAGLGQSRC